MRQKNKISAKNGENIIHIFASKNHFQLYLCQFKVHWMTAKVKEEKKCNGWNDHGEFFATLLILPAANIIENGVSMKFIHEIFSWSAALILFSQKGKYRKERFG